MNENPSVHIESPRSKTSDNRPLKNGSVVWNFAFGNSSTFNEGDYAFKTIWQLPCLCHLVKIKGYFFQKGRPVFIIVINTSRRSGII